MSPKATFSFDLQGHRGARGLLPENTLPAFLLALEIGVTTLELDVVISKDKQVVVSHDPWFNPLVTDPPEEGSTPEDLRDIRLYDLPYTEIRRFNVGARKNPMFPRQVSIPTYKPLLDEVIQHAEAFCSDTGRDLPMYNIETKSNPEGDGVLHPGPEEFSALLIGCLEKNHIESRSTIQSFDPRTLVAAKTNKTRCRLSHLMSGSEPVTSGKELLAEVERVLGFRPDILSPSYKIVTRDLVLAAQAIDVDVLPWTVNTRDEMKVLLEIGVSGIITDYPDVGISLLDRSSG